ncbi:hypothetical protein [Microseira wollei]|uniref:Secreted protein n=1 Tax=Microseira wollei NIES-4236 TaxID=2530354 RepID=A0AAV3XGZ0_9CYAN|nr:hypothetical protein [Microseira wollei]GET39749.1 hypothetical protein MiSe_45210 [Microseira wollei NIES-4236]
MPPFRTRVRCQVTLVMGWSCVSPVILAPRHPVLDFTLCVFIPHKYGRRVGKKPDTRLFQKVGYLRVKFIYTHLLSPEFQD